MVIFTFLDTIDIHKILCPAKYNDFTVFCLFYLFLYPLLFGFQYGGENSYKSLVVEVSWGDNYPDEAPTVNLDTFYNKHM